MGGRGRRGARNVSQFRTAVSTTQADLGDAVRMGRVLTQAPFAFWGSGGGEDLARASCHESQEATGLGFVPAEEIHAEVCYAECLLQRAALTFLQVGTLRLYKQPGDFRRWITRTKTEGPRAARVSPVVVEATLPALARLSGRGHGLYLLHTEHTCPIRYQDVLLVHDCRFPAKGHVGHRHCHKACFILIRSTDKLTCSVYDVPGFVHVLQVCSFYIPYTCCMFVFRYSYIYYLIFISQACKGEGLRGGATFPRSRGWQMAELGFDPGLATRSPRSLPHSCIQENQPLMILLKSWVRMIT